MRTCEERIINFYASNLDKAYKYAEKYGKKQKLKYKNDEGKTVHFEFLGVLDLHDIESFCGDEEVYYDYMNMKKPMERKTDIIPEKEDLKVFKTFHSPSK